MLGECVPGDIVVIMWPEHDYRRELAGRVQLVKVGNVLGGKKKGTEAHTVLVSLVDSETLVDDGSMRGIGPNIEVIDVVERRFLPGDDEHGERSDGDDFYDPLRGRRR